MAVSQEHLKQTAQQLFAVIDKNKNGFLEKSEVREFSVQMLQKIKPDAVFDEAKFEENFEKMDKNADGMVSQEELF